MNDSQNSNDSQDTIIENSQNTTFCKNHESTCLENLNTTLKSNHSSELESDFKTCESTMLEETNQHQDLEKEVSNLENLPEKSNWVKENENKPLAKLDTTGLETEKFNFKNEASQKDSQKSRKRKNSDEDNQLRRTSRAAAAKQSRPGFYKNMLK